MEGILGRTCLILTLLGALLVVTLLVNPGARADGAAMQAGTMQLQGDAEEDEDSEIPEEEFRVTERCELDDPRARKQELAFLLADYPPLTEGKNFIASYDGIATKSKD